MRPQPLPNGWIWNPYTQSYAPAPTTGTMAPRTAVGELDPGHAAVVWGAISTASMALSAYHGYKRNRSVGWAVWWGFMGGLFPVITPVIAVAQGYGKSK